MDAETSLIQRTATAINRENKARRLLAHATEEAAAASLELRDAWTALRDHQDEQVKALVAGADDQPATSCLEGQ